jgi:hypothetical protein
MNNLKKSAESMLKLRTEVKWHSLGSGAELLYDVIDFLFHKIPERSWTTVIIF